MKYQPKRATNQISHINDNLLQQAETLFKNRFLNTDSLPDGWKIQTLGDVSNMTAGGDKPKIISDSKTDDCQYPVYSNGISDEGLYGFTNEFKISEESVYLWLKSIPIHGTGTTQQQLIVPDFRKTEIIIPSEESMSQFTETVDPIITFLYSAAGMCPYKTQAASQSCLSNPMFALVLSAITALLNSVQYNAIILPYFQTI